MTKKHRIVYVGGPIHGTQEYMASNLPPRQNLEQYRDEGYPEGLQPIVDAILDLYERQENTHDLASEARYPPRY